MVALTRQTGDVSALVAQLPQLDAWLAAWQATPAQAREVLLALADALAGAGATKASTALLVKHLQTYEGAADVAAARPVALRALAQVLGDAADFAFDVVVALGAVRQLAGEPLLALVETLREANLDKFAAWVQVRGRRCKGLGPGRRAVPQALPPPPLHSLGAPGARRNGAPRATAVRRGAGA